ncbi:MAG TPA: adaptor protein MecA [Clostridiaceae bacterium]|nr:adaptor protein MecA [Clostridiaceae bacterium]
MKIEKVGENKIKISITDNDLEERNIDINSLNYNSLAAQELFWDLMEQAETEFGFNATNAQIVIEAAPETDGGFVVLITKMDEEDDFESINNYIKDKLSTKKNVRIKRKRPDSKVYTAVLLYSFKSFDDMCSLCRVIPKDRLGSSSVYKYRDTYYLMITLKGFSSGCDLELMLSEYGNRILNINFYEGFLNEHGTVIIPDNAVEIINSYFN